MKFIRRHDLTPHTRIDMVRLAWLNQGIYGKMTQIAQDYHISRTFLYQLIWAANHQLETLFSDQKPPSQAPQPLLEPFILLLRLEGKCSIPSMSSILKYFQYQPNSVGYLSECCQHYGAALPSTLSMAKHTVVFYLSDEIFARHQPILVTIEAHSTAILKIQLASDCAAETWKAAALGETIVCIKTVKSLGLEPQRRALWDERIAEAGKWRLAYGKLGNWPQTLVTPIERFMWMGVILIGVYWALSDTTGIGAGALFAFITSWDEVVVSLFLSTPFLQTLPVVIWTQVRSDVDPTVAAASSLVTGVSLLVLLGLFSARRRANVPG